MSDQASQHSQNVERGGLARRLVARVRSRLATGVTHLTTGSGPTLDYSSPPGDPASSAQMPSAGKSTPISPSMMAGGISALLLQALHPLALAGVWDHSSFRTDILGRLRRTATFIAGHDVRKPARRARVDRAGQANSSWRDGHAPDGRPYRASDPALLTWVHVAEVSSFLTAHLRYVNDALPIAEQDQLLRGDGAHCRDARGRRHPALAGGNRRVSARRCVPSWKAASSDPRSGEGSDERAAAKRGDAPAGTLMLNAGRRSVCRTWAQTCSALTPFAGMRRAIGAAGREAGRAGDPLGADERRVEARATACRGITSLTARPYAAWPKHCNSMRPPTADRVLEPARSTARFRHMAERVVVARCVQMRNVGPRHHLCFAGVEIHHIDARIEQRIVARHLERAGHGANR